MPRPVVQLKTLDRRDAHHPSSHRTRCVADNGRVNVANESRKFVNAPSKASCLQGAITLPVAPSHLPPSNMSRRTHMLPTAVYALAYGFRRHYAICFADQTMVRIDADPSCAVMPSLLS